LTLILTESQGFTKRVNDKIHFWMNYPFKHTHTHTHIYLYVIKMINVDRFCCLISFLLGPNALKL